MELGPWLLSLAQQRRKKAPEAGLWREEKEEEEGEQEPKRKAETKELLQMYSHS